MTLIIANSMIHEHVHQRSLTHHSQFSRLGIQCPTLVHVSVMFVGSGLIRWVSFCFSLKFSQYAMHMFSCTHTVYIVLLTSYIGKTETMQPCFHRQNREECSLTSIGKTGSLTSIGKTGNNVALQTGNSVVSLPQAKQGTTCKQGTVQSHFHRQNREQCSLANREQYSLTSIGKTGNNAAGLPGCTF